jgi:hypothetical protein
MTVFTTPFRFLYTRSSLVRLLYPTYGVDWTVLKFIGSLLWMFLAQEATMFSL